MAHGGPAEVGSSEVGEAEEVGGAAEAEEGEDGGVSESEDVGSNDVGPDDDWPELQPAATSTSTRNATVRVRALRIPMASSPGSW